MNKKQRYYELDLVRSIAAYSVIIVHITAMFIGYYSYGEPGGYVVSVINRFLKYTTPVFIFLAGIMINLTGELERKDTITFYRDKFKKIFIPYFIASIWYMLYLKAVYGQDFSQFDIIKNIITGSAFYHLYFIPILFQMYLISPFIHKISKESLDNRLIILLLICFSSIYSTLYHNFIFSDRFFLKYLFSFTLGLYLGKDIFLLIRTKSFKIFFISTWAIQGFLYAYDFYTMTYLGKSGVIGSANLRWFIYSNLSIFVLLIISNKLVECPNIKNIAVFVSKNSFYIYLVHPYILSLFTYSMNFNSFKLVKVALLTIFVVVVSTLFAYLLGNINKKELLS